MEINHLILEKAKDIIRENKKMLKKEKQIYKYKETCVKANICPICGNDLASREPTKEEEEHSRYDYLDSILECTNNPNHLSQVSGGFYDDDDE